MFFFSPGLRNPKSGCYVNVALQMLYMQPQIRRVILDLTFTGLIMDNFVLYQTQKVFRALELKNERYYIPSEFWNSYRYWKKERLNIYDEDSAYMFLADLLHQMNEEYSHFFGSTAFEEATCCTMYSNS